MTESTEKNANSDSDSNCDTGNTKAEEELLKECATVINMALPWSDMNAAQHISNTSYFRYFEHARVNFFEKVDFIQYGSDRDVGIMMASISCRFRIALAYPDTISIGTKIESMEKDRFRMKFLIVSHMLQKLAAEGEAIIVTYDYKQQCKAPVPDYLLERIEKISPVSIY